jgi:hypothetical protein
MHRITRLLILGIFTVTWLGCAESEPIADQSAELYVDNHVPLAHGPLPATGSPPAWGVVEMWVGSQGADYLGNVGSYYVAHPTLGGMPYIAMSSLYTYAIAYEFEVAPGSYAGRTYVVTPTFTQLAWTPQAVIIRYDDPCPITPGMAVAHACSGDWTPMDSGGVPTVVIGNGIQKPGLPYGDFLKYTAGGGPGSWCGANFSDFPGVTKPAGLPNHVVAVDACP